MSEADVRFTCLNRNYQPTVESFMLAGAWRPRLALKCAVAGVRIMARTEDEAALRDAVLLRAPGDDVTVVMQLLSEDAISGSGSTLSRGTSPLAFRAARKSWRRTRIVKPLHLQDLWVATMAAKARRRKTNAGDDRLFDGELEDLPPDLRWREWMLRAEAVIFVSSEPVGGEALTRVVGRNCKQRPA